jgi:hypothetical protein
VEFTGDQPWRVPLDTWQRVACFVVLNHLDEQSIKQAYEALAGIYDWQIARSNVTPTIQTPRSSVPVVSTRTVQRPPLVFSDEE